MRPITVLPALLRVTNRAIATKMQEALLLNPKLLHGAQRAFLRDGSVGECLDVVLDVIEDCKTRSDERPLLVASYDQKKAYDSVQGYTIRASMERLCLPERLIQYVLTGIATATSKVRTRDGFSRARRVYSGIRQ